MAQAILVDTRTIKDLLITLRELKNEVAKLRENLVEPPYGSGAWWEWAEKKADEDIKAERMVRFDSVEEAIKWLNS